MVVLLHLARFPSTALELVRSNALSLLVSLLPGKTDSSATAAARGGSAGDASGTPAGSSEALLRALQLDVACCLLRALAVGHAASHPLVIQHLHHKTALLKMFGALAAPHRLRLGPLRLGALATAIRAFVTEAVASQGSTMLLENIQVGQGYDLFSAWYVSESHSVQLTISRQSRESVLFFFF